MDKPLVSVLLPCYNVELYIRDSMKSILEQTYDNLEVIAINDCSTDTTGTILHELAGTDSRIKVFENEVNLKLIKTLNKGIDLCSGKYIARMDADDIALPQRIEKEVDFLEKNTDHDIVSTQFYVFVTGSKKMDLYSNPVKYEDLQAYLLFKSGICHPASMIRKDFFSRFSLRFEQEYLHVEDYALWSKAVYLTKLANIPGDPLLLYRVHKNQISVVNEEFQIENKKQVFKIHCEKLGLDDSADGLDIYSSVAEANPKHSSHDYVGKCEKFMLTLKNKNEAKQFCSPVFLEKMLALHWLRLCANSRLGFPVLKKCFSSELFKKEYYSRQDFIILFFKCLFKLRYKKSMIYKITYK